MRGGEGSGVRLVAELSWVDVDAFSHGSVREWLGDCWWDGRWVVLGVGKRWCVWVSKEIVHECLARKHGVDLFCEMGELVFEFCVVRYHGFDFHRSCQHSGSISNFFNSQCVSLMRVVVVNGVVDVALDVFSESGSNLVSEVRMGE